MITYFFTILCRDPDYSWNEWDMRKDALRKSNAKNNRTTSMQTEGEPSAQIKTQIGVQGWESSQMWTLYTFLMMTKIKKPSYISDNTIEAHLT